MRFIADGPDLPGDLLDARDEGQVVFFCGAGVSRHQAGGPSFNELAGRVVDELGSSRTSPARRLIELAGRIDPIPGAGGIPPADRIFALLEQEFPVEDVRRAVARSLEPPGVPGLAAHQALIDLSRAPDGTVRLVTTNFDRVFELADPSLRAVAPPSLPDPARTGALAGVIHLHGKVTLDYRGPDGPEFVLSSADFGRAYLADGWATAFMRSLMDRYRIVFVGYSADDPPMQYLLEALSTGVRPGRLYALQDGEASRATSLWRHKGVTAIPFDTFSGLWTTLDAWAARARDPDGWRRDVAAMAMRGPRNLLPYQRGQVAQLISSRLGARIFAEHEPPPPAEWLCVFDPQVRFDKPRMTSLDGSAREDFDPFAAYGLDGETAPPRNQDRHRSATVPQSSWSAFEAVSGERPAGRSAVPVSLRGRSSTDAPQLTERLARLAGWFGRIAADPVALWWAAGQDALHPDMTFRVRHALLRDDVPAAVRRGWRLLLAASEEAGDAGRSVYDLQRVVQAEGWSSLAVASLVRIERPRLTVQRPMTAPVAAAAAGIRLVDADVAYARHADRLEVPPEHLADYVDGVRRNLLLASRLEQAVGGFALTGLAPFARYELGPGEFRIGVSDISALMFRFAALVAQLYETAPDLALAEIGSWRNAHGTPFRNLRVWAAGQRQLTDPAQAAAIVLSLGSDLWDGRLERDLLITLTARWTELPEDARGSIEAAILAGPEPREGTASDAFEPYRINSVLRRLHWLRREGLQTTFDLGPLMTKLAARLPGWSEDDASEQLDRNPSRGGQVSADKTHDRLLEVPLDQVLTTAEEGAGRRRDFLVEARPFRGLAESRPVRALAALRRAAARGEPWAWAWSDLFWSEARRADSPRLRCMLARRICRLPDAVLAENVGAATYWFATRSEPVWRQHRDLHLATWQRLVEVLARHPEAGASGVVVQGEHEWIGEAINAPAGRLTEMLFAEADWSGDPQALPGSFQERATTLLSLTQEPRAHAAVLLAGQANWLFAKDRRWTERNLLPLLGGARDDTAVDAALVGLLALEQQLLDSLFVLVRPLLLGLVEDGAMPSRQRDQAIGHLLTAWFGTPVGDDPTIASADLREALIVTGEHQRLAALRMVGNWAEASDACAARIVQFVRDVWPRQLVARSPAASAALATLALGSRDRMPEVTAAVLPVLGITADQVDVFPRSGEGDDEEVKRYPQEYLAILHAILPEDAGLWPWGVPPVIEQLAGIGALAGDPRVAELRRRMAQA